jgi:hypothetical protein
MSNINLQKLLNLKRTVSYYIRNHLGVMAIICVVVTVIFSIILSQGAIHKITLNTDIPSHHYLEPNNPLKYTANWDGSDYIHIANYGYDSGFYTGFFPVYPMLIKIVNYLIPSAILCGLLISWASLVGAVYFYAKLVKELCKGLTKKTENSEYFKAVVFFLLFPSGVYLLSVYTESLFALLSFAAIYYLTKKKYMLSAVLVSIACATHVIGVFVLLLMLLMLLEQKIKLTKILQVGIVGSLGLLSYMVYQWKYFNNPLQFLAAQKQHHWLETSLWNNLSLMSLLDAVLIILLITSATYWWKRRRSFSVYSLLFLLIPLLGGQFGGFPRYTMMAFPMTLMLYEYLRAKESLRLISTLVFGAVWAYVVIFFAVGYVVT